MQFDNSDIPRVGRVDFGDLRRTLPIGGDFGRERGRPIDRYYIEHFLEQESYSIRGHVLELADRNYTLQFGGTSVAKSDVLNLTPDNVQATLIADLTQDNTLPSDTFDCIIFTHALQYMYDLQAAIYTLYRILRPSGVLLLTVPGISQISRWDMDRWGEYWRFTTAAMTRLICSEFNPGSVVVQAHGNVLAAIAFLHGLAEHELSQEELKIHDDDYQFVITARAVKD